MKQIIRIIDNISHKTIVGEKVLRDLDHLQSQINFPARTFKKRKVKEVIVEKINIV